MAFHIEVLFPRQCLLDVLEFFEAVEPPAQEFLELSRQVPYTMGTEMYQSDESPSDFSITAPTSLTASPLLTLPYEIRLQIYTNALAIDCDDARISLLDAARAFRKSVGYPKFDLNLLLTCRQFYDEARLLPLQTNYFAFQRWYGSSVAECVNFLNKLLPWQISAIRTMRLYITEADMGNLSQVDRVCDMLLTNGRPALQTLHLHISRAGIWPDPADFDDLFKLDKKWSVQGILKLTSLRTLRVTIAATVKLEEESVKEFQNQLVERMPWCGRVSVELKSEKSPKEKFEAFEVAMGWTANGWGSL